MIKTYLFDFDGTLVDSMPTFIDAMLGILDEYKIPYTPDIVRVITPLGYRGTAEHFKSLGVPLSVEEMLANMHAFARRAYDESIPAKEGVREALTRLRAEGYRLFVLTASPHEMLDVCLMRLGLFDLFERVWSCEDFGTTKADPEIYKMAAREIGAPVSEVAFFDDNLGALQTAKRAGMVTVGVYDASSEEVAEDIRHTADRYIVSFGELMED
jgi:HAD superfamily hydrolase (TIGR01509 family)